MAPLSFQQVFHMVKLCSGVPSRKGTILKHIDLTSLLLRAAGCRHVVDERFLSLSREAHRAHDCSVNSGTGWRSSREVRKGNLVHAGRGDKMLAQYPIHHRQGLWLLSSLDSQITSIQNWIWKVSIEIYPGPTSSRVRMAKQTN